MRTTSTITIPNESTPIRARSALTWSSSCTGNSTSCDRLRRVGQEVFAFAGTGAGIAGLESTCTSRRSERDEARSSCTGSPTAALPSVRAGIAPPRPRFALRDLPVLRRWLLGFRLFFAMSESTSQESYTHTNSSIQTVIGMCAKSMLRSPESHRTLRCYHQLLSSDIRQLVQWGQSQLYRVWRAPAPEDKCMGSCQMGAYPPRLWNSVR